MTAILIEILLDFLGSFCQELRVFVNDICKNEDDFLTDIILFLFWYSATFLMKNFP